MLKVVPMFSEYVSIDTIDFNTEILKKELYKIDYDTTVTKSFISKNLKIHLINDHFNKLKQKIEEHVKKFINNVLCVDTKFTITNFWATKTPPNGGYGQSHTHANSWLSGVYYPETTNGSSIRFYRKNNFCWHIKQPHSFNFTNSEIYDVPIEKNNLIIFPSDTKHSILPNNTMKDRFSIAFNIFPLGIIGESDSQVNILWQ